MNIGVLKVKLRIHESHSLKSKRQAIKPIIKRVQNKFNVSVAEVDDQELWQLATIGISYVSNSSRHANEVLSNVMDYIHLIRGDAEILDYEIELTQAL
ncbi:MAG: DUF503 domain-containing protein [Chloroflexi bacterium]|jgi:uncharacterized protein|nr:DUF503 domain-containing protein [Chloroflexota bacterium]MBT7080312.1 DUF503 domain-containing protein [Chloroflexota bacterium]MBT7289993.1 DUF503 domain-containing protein [Chloroflexota bacterium]